MTQYIITGEPIGSRAQLLPYSLVANAHESVGQTINLTLSAQDEATLITSGILQVSAQASAPPFPHPLALAIGARAVTTDPQITYLQHQPGSGESHCSAVWLPKGEVVARIGTLMWSVGQNVNHGNLGIWSYQGAGLWKLVGSTPDTPALWTSLPNGVSGWVSDLLVTPYTVPASGLYLLGKVISTTDTLNMPTFHSMGVNGTAGGGRSRPFLMAADPDMASHTLFTGVQSVSNLCEDMQLDNTPAGIAGYSSWPHVFACSNA